MSQNLVKRISNLQQQIEDEKLAKAKLEGKKESLMAQLREEFGVETLEDAEDLLDELRTKHKNSEARLETQVTKLEKLLAEKGPV